MWCLIVLAICALLGAIIAVTFRPSQLHLPHPRPARLLRGCLATGFLAAALALAGLAWYLAMR